MTFLLEFHDQSPTFDLQLQESVPSSVNKQNFGRAVQFENPMFLSIFSILQLLRFVATCCHFIQCFAYFEAHTDAQEADPEHFVSLCSSKCTAFARPMPTWWPEGRKGTEIMEKIYDCAFHDDQLNSSGDGHGPPPALWPELQDQTGQWSSVGKIDGSKVLEQGSRPMHPRGGVPEASSLQGPLLAHMSSVQRHVGEIGSSSIKPNADCGDGFKGQLSNFLTTSKEQTRPPYTPRFGEAGDGCQAEDFYCKNINPSFEGKGEISGKTGCTESGATIQDTIIGTYLQTT